MGGLVAADDACGQSGPVGLSPDAAQKDTRTPSPPLRLTLSTDPPNSNACSACGQDLSRGPSGLYRSRSPPGVGLSPPGLPAQNVVLT